MNIDKYVFAQLVSFLDRSKFNRIVKKYDGDKYVKVDVDWLPWAGGEYIGGTASFYGKYMMRFSLLRMLIGALLIRDCFMWEMKCSLL